MLPNKEKHSFYNPIKQNQTHIKWLRSYIGEEIPLFSIIVFSERCELKKVTITSRDIKVIKEILHMQQSEIYGIRIKIVYRRRS